jgi:hypothetical protein
MPWITNTHAFDSRMSWNIAVLVHQLSLMPQYALALQVTGAAAARLRSPGFTANSPVPVRGGCQQVKALCYKLVRIHCNNIVNE